MNAAHPCTPVDLLLPRPVRVEALGGSIDILAALARPIPLDADFAKPEAGSSVRFVIDRGASEHAQGYLAVVRAGAPIEVSAPTTAGLRHGAATLNQLRRGAEFLGAPVVPAAAVHDAPRFATRGVMLDVSRNKVPTMESLRDAIDLFASLKFNHVEFYTEHAFAYAGHEEAWRGWSPITPDEARALDAYGAARGVAIAANQNCFGHLAHWLRIPKYRHLAETHGEWKFLRWTRPGPFSLCPIDPESVEFVRDLLTQLTACYGSPLVNIGCDETFDIGAGRSKEEVLRRGEGDEKRGRAEVFYDFVEKICGVVRSLGKRPTLWADIALEHPELLHRFPKDAIGLTWGYEPDAPFGRWCRLLREQGVEAWVCPGTSSWRSITGRTTESRENMRRAAAEGLAEGATGYLVTDWGDWGHHQQWPVSVNALGHAAELAWGGDRSAGATAVHPGADPRAVSLHALGGVDPELRLGAWLDELGDADLALRRASGVRNATAFFNDLHPPPQIPPNPPGHLEIRATLEQFAEVHDRLGELGRRMPAASDAVVADECTHTIGYADLAVRHAMHARAGTAAGPDGANRLLGGFEMLLAEHRRLWLLRNREGGLGASSKRLRDVIDELQARARVVE